MSPPPFHGGDGIYRSPRPPVSLPEDPNATVVPFLFRNLPSFSDRTALVDAETGTALTFSQLKSKVSKLANVLLNLNISKSDVVLIVSPNSILFPVSFFAVLSIGAIATTANPQYTVNELSKQVKDSNPKLIVTVNELYDKVKHFNLPCISLSPKNHENPSPLPHSNSKTWYYYSDLVESSIFTKTRPYPSVFQSDVAALLYSSGTTGTSKGVVLTHKNFVASSLMATSDQEEYGEDKNVFICCLPLFHVMGLSVILYAQLQRGNTVVIMEKYETEKMAMAVERYRVSHLYVAPPVVQALVKQRESLRRYDLSSLREIGSGAAPLGKELMEECAKGFPRAVIFQGYGLTETCGVASLENTRVGSHHSGSTGVLVPGIESLIIDINTMKPLPPFNKGEIWLRGPTIMQGYLKNEKATAEIIDEKGWLHTGDLGYFDEEGRLYVVDRLKELIKCKGFQVAPAELEELLLIHPGILDAAIIPFPDDDAGEVPIAFVVRRPNSSITEENVKKFIADQVAPFKRLRRVTFVDVIPKSASGKILRRELKQKTMSKL